MLNWTYVNYNVPGATEPYREGACLSTDEKPAGADIGNGSKLMEMDTSILFLYDKDAGEWKEWGASSSTSSSSDETLVDEPQPNPPPPEEQPE